MKKRTLCTLCQEYYKECNALRSVQSVRRKTKTKTRFRFCFLHLFRPIGKENVVKNKNAFLFLIFISPSNRSNKNQIRENMPGMLYFISCCQDYKHVVKLQQAQSSAVCWFHEIINVPSNVRHRRGLVLPYWECCL